MIDSPILKENYRVQKKLAEESSSIKEYIIKSHKDAQEAAEQYGFKLKYAKVSNKTLSQISINL